MKKNDTNQERSERYFKNFDREKLLKSLVKNSSPTLFDVGANLGQTTEEFMTYWPDAAVFCFEPQEECWMELERVQSKYQQNSMMIVRDAVGNTNGDEMDFYTHDVSNGLSGFNKVN